MKQLKKKLSGKGGFTLVEMLIVVAIIAILIAVSIPLVSSSLEKARHAVDQANMRDVIALASIEYLTEDKEDFESGKEYTYYVSENHQGSIDATTGDAVKAQCTCENAPADELKATVDKDGKVTINWATDAEGKTTANGSYTAL